MLTVYASVDTISQTQNLLLNIYRETGVVVVSIPITVKISKAVNNEFGSNTAAPYFPNGLSLNNTDIDIF